LVWLLQLLVGLFYLAFLVIIYNLLCFVQKKLTDIGPGNIKLIHYPFQVCKKNYVVGAGLQLGCYSGWVVCFST
jgi:hypothetical protein